MYPELIGLYLTIGIILWMVWYAGVDGTMRLFQYIELTVRYQVIRLRLYFIRLKLERQLGITLNKNGKRQNNVRPFSKQKGVSEVRSHVD
jgi:hypothetical protein